MNALQQFLLESNVNDLKKTINIGGRMKDHPLTIRVITGQQYTDYQQQCIEILTARRSAGSIPSVSTSLSASTAWWTLT